jgi:hypothetical protein
VNQGEVLWMEPESMTGLWSDPVAGWAVTGSSKALTLYRREGDRWGRVGRVAIQDVEEVCWCPSRSRGIARTGNGGAHSIEIGPKHSRFHPLPLPFPASRVTLNPDGGRVVAVSAEAEVVVLAMDSPYRQVASTRFPAPIHDILMSPTGEWVAFASQVGVSVYGLARLDLLARMDGLGQRTTAMAASPKAPVLALAGEGGRVRCFDPNTGLALGPAWDVRSAQRQWNRIQMGFAPDGRRLTLWMEGSQPAAKRVMEVPTPSGAVQGDAGKRLLLDLADYLAGRRMDEQDRLVALKPSEIERIVKRLREARDAGMWCQEWDAYGPAGGF